MNYLVNAMYVCCGNAPTNCIKGNEKFMLLVRIMYLTVQAISLHYHAVTVHLSTLCTHLTYNCIIIRKA